MENALLIPPEPPLSGRAKGKKIQKENTGKNTKQQDKNWSKTQIVKKMPRWLNQLEDLNQKLGREQINCDKVHAREQEKREKDRKKELKNFHMLYVAKLKLQERKYKNTMYHKWRKWSYKRGNTWRKWKMNENTT